MNIKRVIFSSLLILSCMAIMTMRSEPEAARHSHPYAEKKWRVAYVETEPFGNYAGTLDGLVKGLASSRLLENVDDIPYELGQTDSRVMWEWLASRDTGPYIEFVGDAHYTLVGGDESEGDVEEKLLNRLKNDGDIDLVFAMGTMAGQVVAGGDHTVPTMVFSASNAVQSGIIESETDSGSDHLWAHMDPERYMRQIEVFHDIFDFKRVGMIFEDNETGRIYSAYYDVQKVMDERGVTIITEHVTEPRDGSKEEYERYYNEVLEANKRLAEQVDAMYLSLGLWELDDLKELLQPFYENNIPVFSQLGAEEVAYGALLSVSRVDFSGIGLFIAHNIEQLLNGTKLRDLEQVYGDTPSIALNMEVAKKIGYKPPFDILLVADTIYQNIEEDE